MFYFFLFVSSIFVYYIFDKKGNNVKGSGWIGLTIITVLLCFIAGCRDYGVGTDTLYYSGDYFYSANHYTLKDILTDKMEEQLGVGYFLLNQFAVRIYKDISSPLFFTELCILGGTLFVFKKFQRVYNFNYILLVILYLFLFYNQTLNYMRQLCAATFTFFAYYCFIKKKYRLCMTAIFIAYLFHTSAIVGIIPLIIYYISNMDSTKKRKKLSIYYISFLAIAVGVFNTLLTFFSSWGVILDVYSERYGMGNTFGGGFSTSQAIFLVLGYFLIFLSYKNRILTSQQNHMALLLHTTNIVIVFMGLYSFFLFRLAFYIAFPDLLYQVIILSSKKINGFVRGIYVLLAIFLWLNLYIIHNNCETNPYKSHILGIY